MSKETISSVLKSVDAAQRSAVERRALTGHVRAFELTWMRLVQKDSIIVHRSFTDRERGNIQDLVKRFGAEEALGLMQWTVRSWMMLAKLPYLRLPPLPVFADFYFQRERIWATWRAELQKREELKEQAAERERIEQERAELAKRPPRKSLTEMVEELRRARQ